MVLNLGLTESQGFREPLSGFQRRSKMHAVCVCLSVCVCPAMLSAFWCHQGVQSQMFLLFVTTYLYKQSFEGDSRRNEEK